MRGATERLEHKILEKLSDVDIMTPHVRHALKKLGGAADDNDDQNDPVESMRCMLLHQYQNVEIDSVSRRVYMICNEKRCRKKNER